MRFAKSRWCELSLKKRGEFTKSHQWSRQVRPLMRLCKPPPRASCSRRDRGAVSPSIYIYRGINVFPSLFSSHLNSSLSIYISHDDDPGPLIPNQPPLQRRSRTCFQQSSWSYPTYSFLNHSLTHSLTHCSISLTHSLTDSLSEWVSQWMREWVSEWMNELVSQWVSELISDSGTHTLTHSLIHSPSHSLTHSLTHSFIHWLTDSLTHWLIHSLTHSLSHSLIHSLSHSLTISKTYWNEKCHSLFIS